jgi:hypothetical protein
MIAEYFPRSARSVACLGDRPVTVCRRSDRIGLSATAKVLNDAGSPLNGQTLPDVNGQQRFLRGASASGGTGGAVTMNLGGEVRVDNNQDACTTTVASAPQPDLPILPSYYEVVWVMRVK